MELPSTGAVYAGGIFKDAGSGAGTSPLRLTEDNNMKIINLQRHPVTVIPHDNAKPVTFPTEGQVQVRMKVQDMTDSGVIKDGFWVYSRGLPKPQPDTLYIVSSLVAMFELFQNGRTDLLFPWGLVKDSQGRVHACRALCRPRKEN